MNTLISFRDKPPAILPIEYPVIDMLNREVGIAKNLRYSGNDIYTEIVFKANYKRRYIDSKLLVNALLDPKGSLHQLQVKLDITF